MINRLIPGQQARGRDLAFWADFPDWWEVESNKGLFREYKGGDIPVMASATANGAWYSYQDTGNVIRPSGSYLDVCEMQTDGTDEDETHLQLGGTTGRVNYFSSTSGSNWDQWIEWVVDVDRITANAVSYHFGLASPAAAVADLLTDATGVLSTTPSYVGFHSLASAPQTLRAVYQTAGGSTTVALATAATLAVGTLNRLGIRYNRLTGNCEWWVNGSRMTTVAISASGFPDALSLSPILGFKSNTATVSTIYLYALRLGLLW